MYVHPLEVLALLALVLAPCTFILLWIAVRVAAHLRNNTLLDRYGRLRGTGNAGG